MKILLIIYCASIVYCQLGVVCCELDLLAWKRTNGYHFKKTSSLFSAIIKLFVVCIIPMINIIAGTLWLFSESTREVAKEKLLENLEESA